VVYEAAAPAGRTLIAFDVASQSETVLATGPGAIIPTNGDQYEPYFHPWVTNDGSTVLFQSADSNGVTQVFLIQSDGSDLRQITKAPGGVSDATLSGFGQVAYAATLQARLFQIDISSDTVTVLAPPWVPGVFPLHPCTLGGLDYGSTPDRGSISRFCPGHGKLAPDGNF
jgi:hypothetical protein